MDKETRALILVTYGYLTAAKARNDRGAKEMVDMYERHLTTLGFLDENKVLVEPLDAEQAKLSHEVTTN